MGVVLVVTTGGESAPDVDDPGSEILPYKSISGSRGGEGEPQIELTGPSGWCSFPGRYIC